MRVKTLQIQWHNKLPVLSADFHAPTGLLATGGADKEIKFWRIECEDSRPLRAHFYYNLYHHTHAVNCVRFSPTGEYMVSAADGGEIALWRWLGSLSKLVPRDGPAAAAAAAATAAAAGAAAASRAAEEGRKLREDAEEGQETSTSRLGRQIWKVVRAFSRHERDVMDLAWSADGTKLLSASVDNSVIMWDIARGWPEHYIQDHGHYVQGVAWDPLGQYFVSCSADRTCRVYSLAAAGEGTSKGAGKGGRGQSKGPRCIHVLHRRDVDDADVAGCGSAGGAAAAGAVGAVAATAAGDGLGGNKGKKAPGDSDVNGCDADGGAAASKTTATKTFLFHDENLPSFFRRCSWAPDGSFLVLPAGMWKPTSSEASPPVPVSPAEPAAAAATPASTGPPPPLSAAAAAAAAAPAMNTCHVLSRADLSKPVAHLPALTKPPTAVRFCPCFFQLPPQTRADAATGLQPREQGQGSDTAGADCTTAGGSSSSSSSSGLVPGMRLPYSFVFAVGASTSVIIYDTARPHPVALLGGVHVRCITDLAWSRDGLMLLATSQDGFCTVATFEPGELGAPLSLEEIPSHIRDLLPQTRYAKAVEAAEAAAAAAEAAATDVAAVEAAPSSGPDSAQPARASIQAAQPPLHKPDEVGGQKLEDRGTEEQQQHRPPAAPSSDSLEGTAAAITASAAATTTTAAADAVLSPPQGDAAASVATDCARPGPGEALARGGAIALASDAEGGREALAVREVAHVEVGGRQGEGILGGGLGGNSDSISAERCGADVEARQTGNVASCNDEKGFAEATAADAAVDVAKAAAAGEHCAGSGEGGAASKGSPASAAQISGMKRQREEEDAPDTNP